MKKKLTLSVFLLFIVVLVSCSSDVSIDNSGSYQYADIYGQVVFPASNMVQNVDNNNIAQAVVHLNDDKQQLTDTAGKFAFYNVPVGEHTLKVHDEAFSSDDYVINLTDDGLADIKLDARVELVSVCVNQDFHDNTTFYLFVGTSNNEGMESIKLEYLDENNDYITLAADGMNPDFGVLYEVTDIFRLDQEYKLKVTQLDEQGDEIHSFTRDIILSQPDLYSPEDNAVINQQDPLFIWEEVEGLVEYNFILEYYYEGEGHSYWQEIDLKNNYYITSSQYRLQFDTDKEISLIEGLRYRWKVEAFIYDKANHEIKSVDSKYREFIYLVD